MATAIIDPTLTPYNSVVRLNAQIGTSGWQGTGVLISPDEVLTADHMAYRTGAGIATNIFASPGYSQNATSLGNYGGAVAHYNADIVDSPTISNEASQLDYAVIHLSTPVIGASTMQVVAGTDGGQVHITGYPATSSGNPVDDVQTVATNPSYNLYDASTDGGVLGPGSSGSPVWTYGLDGTADVEGIVSSESGSLLYAAKFTQAEADQINAWVKQDDAQPIRPVVAIYDTTTKANVADTFAQPYAGPVAGVQNQCIDITGDNVNITATTPNWFIHTGSGEDAIAASSGTNVLDGGTGSNFLTGGSGTDTFFVDARAAMSDTWSTAVNFHSGDAATLFGVSQAGNRLQWLDGAGAAGATGLTLHAFAADKPTSSITLAGFSQSDIASGKLATSFGNIGGSHYLYIRAV